MKFSSKIDQKYIKFMANTVPKRKKNVPKNLHKYINLTENIKITLSKEEEIFQLNFFSISFIKFVIYSMENFQYIGK